MDNIFSITITFNPDINVLVSQVKQLIKQVKKVVIVDNSSNNIVDIYKHLEGFDVEIIELNQNEGIAKAQNIGIDYSIKNDASHVILFDHDSLIPDLFVSSLLDLENELLLKGIKVGAIGPSFKDTRTNEIYIPIKPRKTKFLNGAFMEKIDIESTTENYVEPYFIIASGCLIRTDVINSVGMMREELFIDTVDSEWCFRAISLGFRVFMATKVVMMHTVGDDRKSILGKQFSVHSDLRRYYNMRNNLLFLRNKNFSFGRKFRILAMLFARFVLGALYCKSLYKYFCIHIKAITDYLNNRLGCIKY